MSQNKITIQQLQNNDPRWDSYVTGHKSSTFFHQLGWKKIFEETLGHKTFYLYAEEDGQLVGVLPLVHVKSLLFGNSLKSLPFCAIGGAIADRTDVFEALEQEAIQIAQRLGVGSLEFRYEQASSKDRPSKDLYETFSKQILPTEEENMQAIRSKQRNIIRKGIKNGLEFQTDSVDNFFHAYSESVRNLGTPVFSKKLFAAIHSAFPEDTEYVSAYHEGNLISSAMLFYYKGSVCPYYWGGVWQARRLKGNDFLAWQIMCRAADRGCTVFDFGRSKKETGSYQWKVNLGFESSPLYYEYVLVRDTEMPDLSPNNPKYHLFIEAWKRLPLPVSRVLGPVLSRNLG